MKYKEVPFLNEQAKSIEVEEYPTYVYIQAIIVKDSERNKGVGTKVMNEIISYAKSRNKPLVAFASNELGGDLDRLMKWYKSLGFYKEVNKMETDFNYNIRID
ncbi:GNAT family N-acetyltransferase [Priestia filamentosa]|uniref:GNAT family N-acetyltransferase n=1 Tax=Priestia filamentosa TaxID=1402861 RepID=UPI00397CF6FC